MSHGGAVRALVLLVALATVAPGDARGESPAGGGAQVRLDGDGAGWLVRATVNGRVRGVFLLDTGSTLCVLGPHFAKQLGLGGAETIRVQTANGVVDAPVVQVRSLAVGSTNAQDLRAVVHDAVAPPLDGVIGLNFLNRFSYAIDPHRRTLELR
jgi:clan AA aspartic protease (TIGR02281 family)